MFLKLFDSTKITKGAKRSIIFDTNTGFLQLIPNAFFDLLSNDQQNYSVLKKQLDDDSLETLEEYLNFILDNNLGILVCSKKELLSFQSISVFKETPSNVDYLILDVNNSDIFDDKLVHQICGLKIKYLQIRFSEGLEVNEITEIITKIQKFNDSNINEISIIVKYGYQLFSFIKENHYGVSDKFLHFILHSSNEEDFQTLDHTYLTLIKNEIKIPLSCGLIDLKNVNLSRNFYLESQHHNSCLHKKISIDANGNIKNCPSMPQSFGNIKDTTLEEALQHKDFKKYWNLTKDNIEVCKDCEFRYICTDCRAYTERTHDNEGLDTSKPLKCGYNPYAGEWEEWSTNPLKQKALRHYGMQELVHKK
ncbi:SPASM domain peptide maturase, grasp-with-spasm system [Chryseobacterium soldanellicola]|uniref:SPASM domain peptide maturase, grasp-with-spasm system n=1 Tax=Chryseobacterium soldanellicola TaxID=311333 RepID=A0A1H0Y3W1_9FLAO|nr:grasp-with-spasm system SPASM domain peptide maturase [Chryseobacterium soldanellicola]SDQ09828.1 SPASM domain peptide maturase, grasp-with-spasm system [Chryseobacterium soldanellicola]